MPFTTKLIDAPFWEVTIVRAIWQHVTDAVIANLPTFLPRNLLRRRLRGYNHRRSQPGPSGSRRPGASPTGEQSLGRSGKRGRRHGMARADQRQQRVPRHIDLQVIVHRRLWKGAVHELRIRGRDAAATVDLLFE